MLSRIKNILILVIVAIIISFVGFIYLLRGNPKKPAVIPLGDYGYTIEYSQSRIPQVMKQKHLPGFAVVLVDDQNIIWQETFGLANLEDNQAVTSDTVFKLWSVAKAFTAIETLRLVEDGLVDLDTPISAYLPDFSIQSRFPDSAPITIRSILTHRAGLPRNECHQIDFNPNLLADLANSLADCYQTFPVGYRYHYSNIGFDLLGYLIEEMRGEPYPDYLHEALLLPAGMNDSAFLRMQIPNQMEIAPGYEYYEGEYYAYNQGDTTSVPSGNLYATLADMGQFLRFIFRDGEANGEQRIAPDTLKSLFVEQEMDARDPHTMGLGWKIARVLGSEQLVWHDGGPSDGTGALVAFLPKRKLGVVLIANGTTFDGRVSVPLAVEFIELLLETKYGLLPPEEETPDTVEVERTKLENYVGKYIAFGEVMDVILKGDQLQGSVYGFRFNLKPLSETVFQPQHWLADIGLANFLGAPVDLRQLKIEFIPEDEISSDYLIIHLGGISYEICPKYPNFSETPPLWGEIIGDYTRVVRLPAGRAGTEVLGESSIWAEDGVLRMAGIFGPILPISETEIIIMSDVFAGETMVYDPETGNLYHQGFVYKPD